MTVGVLVLLRHGESEWNAKNLFTGWVDVDLSARGEDEARRGGELLRAKGLLPDVVHTSVLKRAIRTAELALHAADRHWIPVRRSWRLNERHYGDLPAELDLEPQHDLLHVLRQRQARRLLDRVQPGEWRSARDGADFAAALASGSVFV